MSILLGSYVTPLLGISIFIGTLTYITYKLLSSYLHKWFEMKPIPEVEGTYPFIGNALQFKTNAGGKKAINQNLVQRGPEGPRRVTLADVASLSMALLP